VSVLVVLVPVLFLDTVLSLVYYIDPVLRTTLQLNVTRWVQGAIVVSICCNNVITAVCIGCNRLLQTVAVFSVHDR